MADIDKVIEAHGGWPGAFVSDAERVYQQEAEVPKAAESQDKYGDKE